MNDEDQKKPVINRRELLKLGAATASSGLLLGQQAAAQQTSPDATNITPSSARSTLIRNATILTMDEELGDITSGDVFVVEGRIESVGANLSVNADDVLDARGGILLPGFVDGHRHLWHTVMRHQNDVWGHGRYRTYGTNTHSVSYEPEDMRISSYAGGLEALNAGVTTVVDYCHNSRTPEHMEAALQGTRDSGVGGFFCYSLYPTPTHGPGDSVDLSNLAPFLSDLNDWRYQHCADLQARFNSQNTAELRFGVALSVLERVAQSNPEIAIREIGFARDINADLITVHVHNFNDFRLVPFLYQQGLLFNNMLLAHGNGVRPAELDMLAEHGVSVAVTAETEIPSGEFPSYHEARNHGVATALGADSAVFTGSDLFAAMRVTLQFQRYHEATIGTAIGSITPPRHLLEAATIGGAKAVGMDSEIGSITPGKRADLMLINTNTIYHQPVSESAAAVVFNTSPADVSDVWIGGKRVKQNGVLVGVDYDEVISDVKASRDGIVERAGSITVTG